MNKGFWKDRKTLLTGHTGFKGGWLSLYLNKMGADVSGYSLKPNTDPSLFYDLNLEALLSESFIGDINEFDHLVSCFQQNKPSVIFHLAAQPLVRESFEYPVETFETNIIGTAKVIKAALEVDSVEAIIIVTSDKCYKNEEKLVGYSEEDPLGGDDPYSASKAGAEIISQSLRLSLLESSKIRLATVRAGNVIGGGDWSKDRLIPDCARAFSNDELVIIRNPEAVRPWQHVLEPLRGYILLAENLCSNKGESYADAWNFAPNYESQKTVREVVEEVSKNWGEECKWEIEPGGPKETNLLLLDNSKSMNQLNWLPVLDFQKAINMTISWYKAYFSGRNMQEESFNQLESYLSEVKK